MSVDKRESIISALLHTSSMSDLQSLTELLFSIQNQLSDIQVNQRKIMKTLRDMRIEERNRLSDLKTSTLMFMKASHNALSEQLDELQESIDEQDMDDDLDITHVDGFSDFFK